MGKKQRVIPPLQRECQNGDSPFLVSAGDGMFVCPNCKLKVRPPKAKKKGKR